MVSVCVKLLTRPESSPVRDRAYDRDRPTSPGRRGTPGTRGGLVRRTEAERENLKLRTAGIERRPQRSRKMPAADPGPQDARCQAVEWVRRGAEGGRVGLAECWGWGEQGRGRDQKTGSSTRSSITWESHFLRLSVLNSTIRGRRITTHTHRDPAWQVKTLGDSAGEVWGRAWASHASEVSEGARGGTWVGEALLVLYQGDACDGADHCRPHEL